MRGHQDLPTFLNRLGHSEFRLIRCPISNDLRPISIILEETDTADGPKLQRKEAIQALKLPKNGGPSQTELLSACGCGPPKPASAEQAVESRPFTRSQCPAPNVA
jgi:hypothetical protein